MLKVKKVFKIIILLIFSIAIVFLIKNRSINMPPILQILLLLQFLLILRRYFNEDKKWFAIIIYCEVILLLSFNLIKTLVFGI